MELSILCLNPVWVNEENFLLQGYTILGGSYNNMICLAIHQRRYC